MRAFRRCLVGSVLLLLASTPLVALPRAASGMSKSVSKSGPKSARSGPQSPRPKTTRVVIETDGPEVVLEASASGSSGATPDDSNQPAGASRQPPQDPAGAVDGEETDTGEVPLPLDEGKWDAVCSVPCERRLPRAALFRITGAGLTTSATFTLPPQRPSVTLEVKTGASRWYWTGVVASVLGGSFLVGGVAPPLLLGGSFSTSGKVLGGAGAVMLGAGLPLWILNRTTVAIF